MRVSHSVASRLAGLILVGWLTACSEGLFPAIATPLPTDYLPTAAALTLAARGVEQTARARSTTLALAETNSANLSTESAAAASFTPETTSPALVATFIPSQIIASPSASLEPFSLTAAPSAEPEVQESPLPPSPDGAATPTPAPPIPEARIQIYRLGELSKIVSPLEVSSRLTCGQGKVVRVELFGEDGRLLARHLRTYTRIPWETARVGVSLDFEINIAAELARLVVSVEDSFGRLIEVNSVNLILLSQGMTELNPPDALHQRIIIQEPVEKAIIQGGKLIVSGRAKPQTSQPLRVMLVGEDGRVLGQRLAGVSIAIPGDYGTFVAEVPYSVTDITPALLTVFEEGAPISEITYLTSLEVILAP